MYNTASLAPNAQDWWLTLRNSSYKAYAYVPRFSRVQDLISKLAQTVLTEDDFDENWELTPQACEFRDALRARWQKTIKIDNEYFYFSSARQLVNIFLDALEEELQSSCHRFIDEVNQQIDDLCGSVEINGICASGQELREGLGLRKLPKHYALMMALRGEMTEKGYEKNASHFIRTFFNEPAENLVSDNYIERLAGLIQSQLSSDSP